MRDWLAAELLRLLEIPSVTGTEAAVLRHLETRAAAFGLPVARQHLDDARWNLLLNPRPAPQLLLVTHVDTVPETIQGESCPVRRDGEVVYGRGAADTKGCIAALLGLMHLAAASGWNWPSLPVTIALTADEEKGGQGSDLLGEHIAAAAAVVMEPTELAVCPVQAGSFEAEVTVSGRDAHGSVFEAGDNAITKAVALINAADRLPWLGAAHPRLGRSGFSVQWISGGSPELAIPRSCRFSVFCRVLPGQDLEAVVQSFADLCRRHDAACEITDLSPAFELDDSHPLVQDLLAACASVLPNPRLDGMPSWTDAENLAYYGIPSVVFGPGRLAPCHTARERVPLPEIEAAARILYNLVHNTVIKPSGQ